MIAPKHLEFKDPTRSNKQYCVVGQPLDGRDGDNLDLLISKYINDDFMLLIKGVEQDPDLGVKYFHPSIDDDREAIDGDKEENNDENAPKTPYDGENMNASSHDEGNIDEDKPDIPYNGENMNASSDDDINNDEVAPDPPTNAVNINDNYDDEKNVMRLPLIHLQMVEITKQLTTMMKKIIEKRLRRKQVK